MDAPNPDDYQPPLRWYGQAWRYLLALAIGGVVWTSVIEAQAEHHPMLFWVDLVVGLLIFVLVAFRRRWPFAIAVIALLAAPISALSAGPSTLAVVSLATRRVWWQVITVGVLNLGMTWLYYLIQPIQDVEPWWLTVAITVAAIAAITAWGMYIGSRRELVWTLRQRAETAEAERDLRAAQARSTERARIAREMHDVLAHRISQISLQSGALAFRDDVAATDLRAGLALIQGKAHEALTDLREVLGVLRDENDQTPQTAPQPTYRELAGLVREARAAGITIRFDDRLVGVPPEAVGRTVFRIVQEAITNATKHAPAATIGVEISGTTEAGVDVVVRNALGFGPTQTPGSGLGLIGLRERAELRGGTLTHGIEPGEGSPTFVLRAWLPWDVDEAAAAAAETVGEAVE